MTNANAGPAGLLLSQQDYAAHMGVADRTVRRWLAAGKLPGAFKQGGAWMIPADARPVEDRAVVPIRAGGQVQQATPDPQLSLAGILDASPAYLDVETAARLLGLSENYVSRHAKDMGGIRAGVGARWMIPQRAVRQAAGLI